MRKHTDKLSADLPKRDSDCPSHFQTSRRMFVESVLVAGAGAGVSSSAFLSQLSAQSAPAVRGATAGRIENAANSANWTIDNTLKDVSETELLRSCAPLRLKPIPSRMYRKRWD